MRVTDLSHAIHPAIPVYPGTLPPEFSVANTLERDGFAELRIAMATHTGTHVDAPAHLFRGETSVDGFEAGRFVGRAVVLDAETGCAGLLSAAWLEPHVERLRAADFALIRTGWSCYWGTEQYFHGFPALSAECAGRLAGLELKGVGIDAISVDPVEAAELPAHQVLLGAGMILVENLARLAEVESESFVFVCLPLRLRGADGSPVRAVAIEDLCPGQSVPAS